MPRGAPADDAAWERRFNELRRYRLKCGNCNVPQGPPRSPLGTWVKHQRKFYRKETLSSERIKRLEEIGFVWEVKQGRRPKAGATRGKGPACVSDGSSDEGARSPGGGQGARENCPRERGGKRPAGRAKKQGKKPRTSKAALRPKPP